MTILQQNKLLLHYIERPKSTGFTVFELIQALKYIMLSAGLVHQLTAGY